MAKSVKNQSVQSTAAKATVANPKSRKAKAKAQPEPQPQQVEQPEVQQVQSEILMWFNLRILCDEML